MSSSSSNDRDLAIPTSNSAIKIDKHIKPDTQDVYDPQVASYLTGSANNESNNQYGSVSLLQHGGNVNYSASAAAAAAELQHRAELQRRQQQLQQQELQHQQEQLQQYRQVHVQAQVQQREQQQQQQQQFQQQQQQQSHPLQQQQHHHQQHQQFQQQQQQQYQQFQRQLMNRHLAQQQQQHQLQQQQQLQQLKQQQQQQQEQLQQLKQQQQLQQQQQQQLQQQQLQQAQQHHQLRDGSTEEFNSGDHLHSRFIENEIIKTFNSKSDLVTFVRKELTITERSKIVINSSKPKAIYFQCERSGSFRTTVKDPEKRQRVAYTKRNKCGYRLVANLYSNEKEHKRKNKSDDIEINDDSSSSSSGSHVMWVLRMINPQHNHPPDPASKKRRQKISRTLVETPKNKGSRTQEEQAQLQIHAGPSYNELSSHGPQVVYLTRHQGIDDVEENDDEDEDEEEEGPPLDQPDAAVIAAIEASTGVTSHHELSNVAAVAVAAASVLQGATTTNTTSNTSDSIDPNVDPNVQAHDHAHELRSRFL